MDIVKNNNNSSSNIFYHDFNELKKFWKILYESYNLKESETIRIVTQINSNEKKIFTEKEKINSLDNFIKYIKENDNKYGIGNVGYSISAGIFKFEEGKRPSQDNFIKIKNIVIDIDIYKNGERYLFGEVDEELIKFALLVVNLYINMKLNNLNIQLLPSIGGMTGSGLMLVYKIDNWLDKSKATILFEYLKKLLNKMEIPLITEEFGVYDTVIGKIDSTFADITHVQRALGTINQKYGIRSKLYDIFNPKSYLNNIEEITNNIIQKINNSDLSKEVINNFIKKIENIKSFIISSYKKSVTSLDSQKIIGIANIEKHSKKSVNVGEIHQAELQVLREIKNQGIDVVDIIKDYVEIDSDNGNYVALKCPFHEDKHYSFAIYRNKSIDVFYDFHDNKSYTIVTFWEKLFNVEKSVAISEIVAKTGIRINKSALKDFEKLEVEEVIHKLIEKIDTENYIYYRLSNKNKVHKVRHIKSGKEFVFDSVKSMVAHILQNQLSIDEITFDFMSKFSIMFQTEVLIDAFEEFAPGKPTIFKKEFITYVNTWVPSINYIKSHEKSKEINEEYDIDNIIDVLKEKTPWSYKYLMQISQKGNIKWLINWLANTAKFKVMPTIPVIFGSPGVGKNLFINTIIEWYHNPEYTKVLNSDRVMSRFNSVLESASIIVLDEGDIGTRKEFDALKFISGNDKIAIEKKGVDTQMKQRYFNIILFSNGETPVRHHYNDRRIQYFYTEIPLIESVSKWGVTIEEFIEKVISEQELFWAILLNLKTHKKWSIMNEKDKLFIIQILKQHPFGELLLKLLNDEWKDIALQLNENVQDKAIMKANIALLNEIKHQFENDNSISLTLINRYLNSMNYKYKTTIQQFIKSNNLKELGIDIVTTDDEVKITLNKSKLKSLTNVPNILKIRNVDKAIDKMTNVKSKIVKTEKIIENVEAEIVEINKDLDTQLQNNQLDSQFIPPELPDIKINGIEFN